MFRKRFGLGLLAALLGASIYVPVAAAETVRVVERTYVYYPTQEIYYAPDRSVWYWLDRGNWNEGATLPAYYQQYTNNGVRVMLADERPHVYHTTVTQQYGGRQHKDKHHKHPKHPKHPKHHKNKKRHKHKDHKDKNGHDHDD